MDTNGISFDKVGLKAATNQFEALMANLNGKIAKIRDDLGVIENNWTGPIHDNEAKDDKANAEDNMDKAEQTILNMNGAIKASHGDILINLAGDDRFCEKNTVSKIVDYMDQNSLDNLVCRRKTVEDNFIPNDRQVKFLKKFNTANKQKKAIVNGYLLASGSVFSIRKQLIDRLDLYDERYILIEDMPFFYKMTQNNIKILCVLCVQCFIFCNFAGKNDYGKDEQQNDVLLQELRGRVAQVGGSLPGMR